jgi:hypothetical protein
MKKSIKILAGTIIIGIFYLILGILNLVPLRHCDNAMGPNGLVHVCDWHKGPFVEHDY